jgi:D-Tyr-tRNAtyr deacylase
MQYIDPANPDYDKLCIKVGPRNIEEMQVKLLGGDVLEVAKPTLYAKTYKIDRPPYQDGDSIKMVLNGVTLIKQ